MKMRALFLMVLILAGQAVAAIYTNVVDGTVLPISSNVSVTNTNLVYTETGILVGGGGTDTVELTGSGNLPFHNESVSNWPGVYLLTGIAGNVIESNYTGSLTVENDLSTYTASGSGQVDAQGEAWGVSGNLTGNLTGNITVVAKAGSATASGANWAFAHATAKGVDGDVTGDINGMISASSTGGTALADLGAAGAYSEADGVNGNVTGNVNGTIIATAVSGTATATNHVTYAGSTARGIQGDVTGNISGNITASSTAGTTYGPLPSNSSTAAGIEGDDVHISQFSGNNLATETAGKTIHAGTTNAGVVTAHGILATNSLMLTATGGSIHAIILAPDGLTLADLPSGSGAYALMSGTGNDVVSLTDVDLIGDIDLGTGSNQLDISGDTRMKGDIGATGGTVDFLIRNGRFTPVGTVNVSNLQSNQMTIASTGGLNIELYDSSTNSLNSKLNVNGDLIVNNGASIAFFVGAGLNAGDVTGKTYQVVSADTTTGTFDEVEHSLFEMTLLQDGTNTTMTAGNLKAQIGTSTPSGSSVTKATATAANAVMNNLSAHSSAIRSTFRLTSRQQDGPEGASGPAAVQTLTSGEWLVYVRQFNDYGVVNDNYKVTSTTTTLTG